PAKARDRDAAGISHAATVSTVSPGAGGSASPQTVSFRVGTTAGHRRPPAFSAQPHRSPAPVTVGTTYFGFLSSNRPMTGDCARLGRYGHADQRPRYDLLPAATWLIGAAAGRSDSRQYGPATRLVGRQPLRATV